MDTDTTKLAVAYQLPVAAAERQLFRPMAALNPVDDIVQTGNVATFVELNLKGASVK